MYYGVWHLNVAYVEFLGICVIATVFIVRILYAMCFASTVVTTTSKKRRLVIAKYNYLQ